MHVGFPYIVKIRITTSPKYFKVAAGKHPTRHTLLCGLQSTRLALCTEEHRP